MALPGTGGAVLAARAVIESLGTPADAVLVAYADTPLLRSESLLGLLTRHTLKRADLSLLAAVVSEDLPTYGRIVREDGEITAILEEEDRPADAGIDSTPPRSTWAPTSRPPHSCSPSSRPCSRAASTGSPSSRAASSPSTRASPRTASTTPTRSGASTPRGAPGRRGHPAQAAVHAQEEHRHQDRVRHGRMARHHRRGYTLANVRRLCQAIANETVRKGIDGLGS
ncbi:hypothetical protein NKG05_09335 [Oerskovia sp. M15]